MSDQCSPQWQKINPQSFGDISWEGSKFDHFSCHHGNLL